MSAEPNGTDGPDSSAAQASTRRLVGETAKMASGTMVSRILGFVKAALLVAVLGAANPQAETFTYATLVPNTLYMLFAGGALNTVLVPQIVRHIKTDADGGEAFVNRIVTAFGIVLLGVTLIATVLTPQVMSLWTSSTWRTDALAPHWSMLVLMAYLTMPQLFFFGAFFLVGQVLNANDRFAPMMWAPIVNNIVGIAVLGAYVLTWGVNAAHGEPFTTEQVVMLGVGSTLGIVAQTLALVPAARQIGFRYRPRWDLKGTGLGATFHLAKWMLGYVMLTTIAQVVVSKLASDATVAVQNSPGAGMTAYQNALLIWILPHSLLTVSLATAMLPSASRLAAANDMAGVAAETNRTMRLATTFIVPAAVGFAVLGFPFVQLFFGFGRGGDSWQFIALTLLGFAGGLVPYTIQYVYLRGFYALEDTRTPFVLQCLISGSNIVLAWLFVAVDPTPMTIAPRLALAYSVAYLIGAFATYLALRKRLPLLSGRDLLVHLGRVALAVAPGAALAWVIASFTQGSRLVVALGFVAAAVVALVGFFGVAKRLGIAEASQVMAVASRRGRGAGDGAGGTGTGEPRGTRPVGLVAEAGAGVGVGLGASEATERPLLAYPDPRDGHTPATGIPDGLEPVSHVAAGDVLGERYRLGEVLYRRGGTLTWLGFDLTLSRPVLVHVLSPGEPRALQILDQARLAAPAVDSRFLRVWDAVLVEDDAAHGSYIVCEYAPGQSLELALRRGPLTDLEAAWVVRELADGLAAMHALGLYHRQLNPDTVVITASGNVKIVGFLIEAALHPEPDDASPGEAQDVRALADLLYASLLGRWPRGARYGLPAAPADRQGRPLLPGQVSPRVPRTLDDIVDRIVSPVPRGRASRLTTAHDVALALGAALGGADGSRDLEQRLRFPITPVTVSSRRAVAEAAAAVAPLTTAPLTTAALTTPMAATRRAEPLAPLDDTATGDATQPFADFFADADGDTPDPEPFTPIPPPVVTDTRSDAAGGVRPPNRRWWAIGAGILAVVIVAALSSQWLNPAGGGPAPTPTPGAAWAIVGVRDFDPRNDGGDARENPDQAGLAVDSNPATGWTTEFYGRSADFNGRKPGVGLILDLGETRRVGWVTVDFGEGAVTADIRVPQDATASTPPMTSRASWRVVQALPTTGGRSVTQLSTPVETRFVMIYVTRMAQRNGQYQASVHEVSVAP